MKVEYDAEHDLLYVWFGTPGTPSARTDIIGAGTHAAFDREGKLLGIEVLDASELLGPGLNVEVALKSAS